MASFVQIHKFVHNIPFLRFYIIWIMITVAAVISVVRVVAHLSPRASQNVRSAPIPYTGMARSGWRGRLTVPALLALFLACYIALMLTWEDFAYYDNSMFTSGTLLGHDLTPVIVREAGRFWPLGLQEFNVIRHFTHTATGYHVLPIAQLIIFSYILLILDSELSSMIRAALTVLALLTPSILLSFSGLIYPERNVLFFLVCLLFSVKRFEQTRSIAWALAAVVCAQFMIYFKETAFLLLLGFAVGSIVLRWRSGAGAKWDHQRLWDNESRLGLCLASLGVIYLLFFLVVVGIHGSYAVERQQPLTGIVVAYLRLDLLAWLFVAIVLGRVYLILRHRAAAVPFWDGLACGGVACFLAYVIGLRIFSAWYLAPVDLIAVLYVGRFAALSWNKIRSWRKLAALIPACMIVLQSVLFSAFAVFERKNDIHAKEEIATVVKTQYRNREGEALRLFFPFASLYVISEFGSYLNYRAIPVERTAGAVGERNSVVLATPILAKDARCWPDGPDVECRAVSGPAPGDLVIVLPDDEASLVEASVYRERGEQLFSYEPRPPFPHWLHSLAADVVGRLNIAGFRPGAFRGTRKTLSDRWMDASVTVWE